MAGHSALPPGAELEEGGGPPWASLAGGLPGNLSEGANPFSFKAFVRSQEQKAATASYMGTKNGSPEEPLRSCLLLDESSFLAESLGSNKDLREPFFEDPTPSDSLLQDEEDDWSGSYQPSAVEEAHLVRAPSASLSSSPIDSFYGNVSDLQTFSPEQLGRNDHVSCGCLGKGDQSSLSDQTSPEDGFCRLLQLRYQEKRALKAENSVIKLKQENMHLQVQMESLKSENKALKSGHLENLTTVKQNADVALQNLLSVITRSKSSIKQLVSGAEELQLVADLLRSLDKISEIPSQGTP
ncbi:PREDICTED: serologically defined colon cancer antigen 3 isoform X2 [Thamnophis sirtalis]|uniref:Endosome-associated-trafficking regulator 1 n=1 Tax=Thamnophis sirtalis TaxID=35019 RepID=A0A6I9XUV2_9SAUR|nr:PREDICTED: serologically defined colon cancer antigen 3 isoform X2 [Thamnophis sirtalis]